MPVNRTIRTDTGIAFILCILVPPEHPQPNGGPPINKDSPSPSSVHRSPRFRQIVCRGLSRCRRGNVDPDSLSLKPAAAYGTRVYVIVSTGAAKSAPLVKRAIVNVFPIWLKPRRSLVPQKHVPPLPMP